MRALADIASTVNDPNLHADIAARGRRLFAGCEGRIQSDDLERLRCRLAQLESGLAAQGAADVAGKRF